MMRLISLAVCAIEDWRSWSPLSPGYMLEIIVKVKLSKFEETIAPTVFHLAVDQFYCSLDLPKGPASEDCEYRPSGPIWLEQGLSVFFS